MKIWKLISLLLLTAFVGACDDDEKWSDNENGGNAGGSETNVEACFGYEAKTVLKNAGQVLVPVKLAKPVSSAVKVTVAAEKGSGDTDAREGIDFNLPEKVVTIPAGDTVAHLTVDLLDNGKTDNERVVKLNMTGVYGGKLGTPHSASLHIVSNAFVEFGKAKWETWESANVETSSEEVRNSRFIPLTITGEITEPATIVFEVTDSSAIEPTHFSVEKELVVTPGTTTVNVEIKPVDDLEVNDDRIFILKIKEIRGGNLLIGKTNSSCEVKILSEEILRSLSWGETSKEVTDQETIIRVPVSLDKVPLETFTVDIVADDQTDAVEGVDYQILTSQISIDASRQATVEVKVLNNREVNADRTLVLKFANITDNTISIKENAKSFTLGIKNSDFPVFVGGEEAVEDAMNEVSISIPAVDRERIITLEYSSTESVEGTYFTIPAETVVVPAGAESVQLSVDVKYTVEFPTVAPELTVSIVKVDEVVLENAVNTTLVLTPCDYRKLIGDWDFKIGSYDGNGKQFTDLVRNMTFEMKEWKKSFVVKTEWIVEWGQISVVVLWNEETGNASWSNDVPLYKNVGFGSGVDVYLRTAYDNDQYWTAYKTPMPLVWNADTKTFVWDISAKFGVRSDFRNAGTDTDGNTNGTWFIFGNLSMTKK